MRRRLRLRFTFPLTVLTLLALALPAAASIDVPVLYINADNQYLSGSVNLYFDAERLDTAGDTERMTVIVPPGYGVNLAHAAGSTIGYANINAVAIGGGYTETLLHGSLMAMARTAYAASASAQACQPGTPTAAWEMQLYNATRTGLQIPIAIGEGSGGTYFTLCFDAVHAMGLEVRAVQFFPHNSFATPIQAGRYLFDAIVTPFAPGGTPDTGGVYELRAYEDLPQNITVAATYSTTTKRLTVSGTLTVDGKTPSGATVDVRATTSRYSTTVGPLLGHAQTSTRGAYAFGKKLAVPPKFVYANTSAIAYATCSGSSPQPAGCASYSLDGTGSYAVKVITTK